MTQATEARAPRSVPIIFQDEMVAAILRGQKTVTRRFGARFSQVKAGDQLWIREAHYIHNFNLWPDLLPTSRTYQREAGPVDKPYPVEEREFCFFRLGFDRSRSWPWRSPIHMPRWASRLLLYVEMCHEHPDAGMISNWEAWKEGFSGGKDENGEPFGARDAFLRAFRKMHPDLPWREERGFIYLDTPVPVWRVQFRLWTLSDPCLADGGPQHQVERCAAGERCAKCGVVQLPLVVQPQAPESAPESEPQTKAT